MLGYVKIDKGELKVREYEIYTGYYCGICKSIGKRYGQLPRMALSYDAAFLAVILAALDDGPDEPAQEHCIAHPAGRKRTIIRNRAIDYAGDVMLILAWYKLIDDAKDEGRLYAKATMLLLKRIYKRLKKQYPDLCKGIARNLSELSALEKEKCPSLDMAAEAFSKIMEVIFAEGIRAVYGDASSLENGRNANTQQNDRDPGDKPQSGPKRTAQQTNESEDDIISLDLQPAPADRYQSFASIGYHMGKWIYLIDAVDDIEENIESGAYNPLLYRFQYDADSETPDGFRARIEPDIRFNLYHYLAVLSNYIDTLDIKKNTGIIENVIYFGLNRKTEEIITRTEKDKQI